MTTVTVKEAQLRLPALIAALRPGEELLIVSDATPVARLVGAERGSDAPRRPGTARGQLTIHADDNGHLDDFGEYMQ
jgi:antitoxin (DNA-binding transcriptional repressor) of toxin-antitoxin stability system